MSAGSGGRFKASEGDWVCSKEECQNVNFARRDKCNKCGKAKDNSYIVKNSGSEIGSRFAEKSKGLFSADDWQCSKCSNINWARRTTCNVCNAPKVGPDEERTGFGGGFKENTKIEYNQRDDSDGEYDEYGRKKKKYRGTLPAKTEEKPKEGSSSNKSKEYEEEEDDDDDDDEDGDLSKYNLSSDDDDDKPPPSPKIIGRSRKTDESTKSDKRDRSRSPISRS